MNRNQFLKSLGLSGGAILATYCIGTGLSSCSSESPKPTTSTPSNNSGATNLTLDLNAASNANLKNLGGYIITNNIVVARTNSGDYVAVENLCSHENQRTITFNAGGNKFVCGTHGAEFSTTGTGLNSFGSKGIKVYTTKVDGNTLTITG